MPLSTLPVSLDEVLAFERNVESGFVELLVNAGLTNVASSRSGQVFQSPFVSLWFQNGEPANEAQKALPNIVGALLPFTTYNGVLTTEIVTNRPSIGNAPSAPVSSEHTTFIAKLRKNLQAFRAVPRWLQYQNIALLNSIRESGTVDTWNDEQNLDHTSITWAIRHSINPNAWSANIYD